MENHMVSEWTVQAVPVSPIWYMPWWCWLGKLFLSFVFWRIWYLSNFSGKILVVVTAFEEVGKLWSLSFSHVASNEKAEELRIGNVWPAFKLQVQVLLRYYEAKLWNSNDYTNAWHQNHRFVVWPLFRSDNLESVKLDLVDRQKFEVSSLASTTSIVRLVQICGNDAEWAVGIHGPSGMQVGVAQMYTKYLQAYRYVYRYTDNRCRLSILLRSPVQYQYLFSKFASEAVCACL